MGRKANGFNGLPLLAPVGAASAAISFLERYGAKDRG